MSYDVEIKEPSKADFKGVRKSFNKRRKDKDIITDRVKNPYKREKYNYEDEDYYEIN